MFTIKRDERYRLRQNSPEEEKVVVALLRNYGGLFSEYNYIDEGLIAQQAGLTRQQVYLILKSLGQRHILHFIPQSRTPYIRYQQRREDAHLLVFKPDVYQERKKQYQQRIKAITHYLQNDRICRSRQLLRYFGERNEHNCGKCDVCRSSVKISDERLDALTQQVLQLLSDQASHHVSELNHLNIDSEELDAVLSYLLLEEIIYQTDGYIIKA
jgi:ATP-dependent DNA helicase RecQ